MFGIGVRENSKIQLYSFLQYTWVTCPMNMVGETFGCVFLRWSTDDEMEYSPRIAASNSKQ